MVDGHRVHAGHDGPDSRVGVTAIAAALERLVIGLGNEVVQGLSNRSVRAHQRSSSPSKNNSSSGGGASMVDVFPTSCPLCPLWGDCPLWSSQNPWSASMWTLWTPFRVMGTICPLWGDCPLWVSGRISRTWPPKSPRWRVYPEPSAKPLERLVADRVDRTRRSSLSRSSPFMRPRASNGRLSSRST